MSTEEHTDENIDDFTQPPSPSTSSAGALFTQREFALFLMKSKEVHKVSQSSLQGEQLKCKYEVGISRIQTLVTPITYLKGLVPKTVMHGNVITTR